MRSLATFAVSVLIAFASHAEVSKQDKPKFARAEQDVVRAERDLGVMTSEYGKFQAKFSGAVPLLVVDRFDKKAVDLEGLVRSATKTLDEVSAGPEVQALRERLATVSEAGKAFAASLKGEVGKVAQESTSLAAGLETDKPRAEALGALLEDFGQRVRDASHPVGWVDRWATLHADAKALLQTYDGKRGDTDEAKWMMNRVKLLKAQLATAERARDAAVKALPGMIDAELTKAERAATEAVQQGTTGAFISTIPMAVSKARHWAATYAALAPEVAGAATDLPQKWDARFEALAAQATKQEAKIIAENDVPPNSYSGPDATELVAIAKKAAEADGAATILGVRLVEDRWRHDTSWNWDAPNARWYRLDQSSLNAAIVTASPDGKEAWVCPATFTRYHLEQNRTVCNVDAKPKRPRNPENIFSRSKWK